MTEPGWLTFDQFSGRVGEVFDVSVDGGPTIRTELVEAVESGEPGGTGPQGQPRLPVLAGLPRAGGADAAAGAPTRVDHADLGELEMFLVPIGPDADGMRYQAVFA